MSLIRFVNDFVVSENDIYDYSKKERTGLRKRLKRSMSDFMFSREKRLYDEIHYLKRKNKKIEEDYEILSNLYDIDVKSINKTIDNTLNDETDKNEIYKNDIYNNEIYNNKMDNNETDTEEYNNVVEELESIKYDYYNGYKMVALSFIRMCIMIYLALFVVYVYDVVKTNVPNNE